MLLLVGVSFAVLRVVLRAKEQGKNMSKHTLEIMMTWCTLNSFNSLTIHLMLTACVREVAAAFIMVGVFFYLAL